MVRPKNSLDPGSQPWARTIESELDSVTSTVIRNSQSTVNVFRSVNATLSALGDTIATLAATVNALPITNVYAVTTTNWQATNNGIIASITVPWVAGKTRCDIVTNIQGFYVADYAVPMSDRPAFQIGINGTYQPPAPKIPDNMDTYWIVGSYAAPLTTAVASFNVTVRTATGPLLSVAYPQNSIYLSALAIFS